MIDWGFVVAAFVPYILVVIYGEGRLETFVISIDSRPHLILEYDPILIPCRYSVWRSVFGFGVLPPLAVLLWRSRMHETLRFEKESMMRVKTPYWLIFKRYWRSLIGLSSAWFLVRCLVIFRLISFFARCFPLADDVISTTSAPIRSVSFRRRS